MMALFVGCRYYVYSAVVAALISASPDHVHSLYPTRDLQGRLSLMDHDDG